MRAFDENEERISPWNSMYVRADDASPNYEYMRERDIHDIHTIREREGVIGELEKYRTELLERLNYETRASITVDGTFTIDHSPNEECDKFVEEEPEEKELLFDPKDLDV